MFVGLACPQTRWRILCGINMLAGPGGLGLQLSIAPYPHRWKHRSEHGAPTRDRSDRAHRARIASGESESATRPADRDFLWRAESSPTLCSPHSIDALDRET